MPLSLPTFLRAALAAGALAALTLPAAAQTTVTFAMPTTAAAYLLPYFVAQDLGWYEKAGVKMVEKVVTGDVNCLRAVIAGEADITDIGPNTVMQGFISGGKIKIIGAWQPIVDYHVVMRNGAGDTLADLKDKRWAISSVGGMVQALPKMMMAKYGIDGSKAQFMSVGGYSARYQALLGDRVDATLLDTMLTLQGTKAGRIKLLKPIIDDFPGLGFVYIPARQSALANPVERKALETVMREGIRGARYIADNPRGAAEILEKRLKSDNVAETAQVLEQMTRLGVWGLNGGLERAVYDTSLKVYRETGEVPQDVPYEQLVDASIVEASLQVLGRR